MIDSASSWTGPNIVAITDAKYNEGFDARRSTQNIFAMK